MGWFEEEHKKRQERIERERREEKEKKEQLEEQIASARRSNTAKLKIALDRFRNFKRQELKPQKGYACEVGFEGGKVLKSGEDYISEAIFYFRTTPLRGSIEKKLTKANSPFISIKAEGSESKFTMEKNFQEQPPSEPVRAVHLHTPPIDASLIDEAYVDNLIEEFVKELMAKK